MKPLAFGIIFWLILMPRLWSQNELNEKIFLPKSKGSIYEMLNMVSDISGYFFVYDSHIINNEKKIKISKGEYSIKDAIANIVKDDQVQLKIVGKHILLFKEQNPDLIKKQDKTTPTTQTFFLSGVIRDKETRDPISFASVSLPKGGIGTIANKDGEFILKMPDSLKQQSVTFSHIGYLSSTLPVILFSQNNADIYLETHIIPIQEIIVGLVNPQKLIKEMLEKRERNYSLKPVYLTTFYREGTETKKGFVNLTEAIFKVYKTSYDTESSDHVKLLKMRKISSTNEKDSLVLKMQAGILASLTLDLVKTLPDFLTFDDENPYNYTKIDMVVTDSSLAHIIAFEPKKNINLPLYKGELYIDAENSALLKARFQINPEKIEKAEDIYVLKKSKDIDIKPQEITYMVSYRPWNGKYYVNHIRGDLTFKIKNKKQIFSRATNIHTYFEMATCKIDTTNVKRIPSKESISSKTVFSDTHFVYDKTFWGDFNVIQAEDQLSESIARISAKIEENEDD